jgi:hypothetical protein
VIEIIVRPSSVGVRARGRWDRLTEICEQFAWLGSALRTAATASMPCLTTPQISFTKDISEDTSEDISKDIFEDIFEASPEDIFEDSPEWWDSATQCLGRVHIEFVSTPVPKHSHNQGSRCWHGLFRNPSIAGGFPMLARDNDEKGLEISLDMLYALAETRYATQYEKTLLLKGHCTLLVPTRHKDSSIVWHFLHSQGGSRLPYHTFRQYAPDQDWDYLSVCDLEDDSTRHFVGWTPDISINIGVSLIPHLLGYPSRLMHVIGTETVEYDKIACAGQKTCTSGIAIEQKLTVSLSKIVGISGSFVRGNKDKPEYVKYSSLSEQVEFASSIFVVLYDVASQRGWLTDGASALLHIVRTQLARGPYSGHESCFNNRSFNKNDFKHPEPDNHASAALYALRSEQNLKHIVLREFDSYSEEKVEPHDTATLPSHTGQAAGDTTLGQTTERKEIYKTTSFKQLVVKTWGVLEQLYDRQMEMTLAHTCKELHNPTKMVLEGYEFMDIVSYKHVLTRRATTVQCSGPAWVDLVRKAHAIVLFGNHFGDVYRPAESVQQHMCSPWGTVPRGREFLTAPISLIRRMQQNSFEEGQVDAGSNEILRDIFWYPSRDMLRKCQLGCEHDHPDRVQRLSPKRKKAGRVTELESLPKRGAVIFGISSVLNTQERGPLAVDQLEDDPNDSGLGSSIQMSSISATSATSQTETEVASQSPQRGSATPVPCSSPIARQNADINASVSGTRKRASTLSIRKVQGAVKEGFGNMMKNLRR